MKYLLIFILLTTLYPGANGQNERKFARQGNRYYLKGVKDTTRLDTVSFSKAETEYRKALDKKPDDLKWNYNLNNSVYKQTKFKEAADGFEQLAKQASAPVEKARIYHNLGNSRLFQKQIDESIEAYKKALRNNPTDLETKYNLAYAQRMKQQQQQQNQNQNKDQNKDRNKDQQKQNQDQNKDQNKDQDKQQQQPPPKISKQNAEQLLQALQNDEKNIQEKVQKAKAVRVKTSKIEKDW